MWEGCKETQTERNVCAYICPCVFRVQPEPLSWTSNASLRPTSHSSCHSQFLDSTIKANSTVFLFVSFSSFCLSFRVRQWQMWGVMLTCRPACLAKHPASMPVYLLLLALITYLLLWTILLRRASVDIDEHHPAVTLSLRLSVFWFGPVCHIAASFSLVWALFFSPCTAGKPDANMLLF